MGPGDPHSAFHELTVCAPRSTHESPLDKLTPDHTMSLRHASSLVRVARRAGAIIGGAARAQPKLCWLSMPGVSTPLARPHHRQLHSASETEENLTPDFAPEDDVELVVRNLLYNHPDPSDIPEDAEGQVLSVLVEDEPGVLSRVASLLSGRGHNIKSLSVSPTNLNGISRMTITVLATVGETRKIIRQIEGVEEVLVVMQSSRVDSVHREVLLLKMSTSFSSITNERKRVDLLHKKRTALKEFADLFGAEVIDIGHDHFTLVLTSWPKRIDAMVELARPYGIVEIARSGVVAMPRSKVSDLVLLCSCASESNLDQSPLFLRLLPRALSRRSMKLCRFHNYRHHNQRPSFSTLTVEFVHNSLLRVSRVPPSLSCVCVCVVCRVWYHRRTTPPHPTSCMAQQWNYKWDT
eukprot:m.219200 g.219200  ORF g.219200 m.219200 type:complete len:408 (-) comp25745_c0_seq1:1735-2958(-)